MSEAPGTRTTRARRGSPSASAGADLYDGDANLGAPRSGAKRRRVEPPSSPPAGDAGGIFTSASKSMAAATSARATRGTPDGKGKGKQQVSPTPSSPARRAARKSADSKVAGTASTKVARTTSPAWRTSGRGASGTAEVTQDRPSETAEKEQPTPRMVHSPKESLQDVASPGIPGVDADATLVVPTIFGGARVYGPGNDTDVNLKNSYDSINLVRSDLIREFEKRGVDLAKLQKENETLSEALRTAERSRILAESDSHKWREAKSELEEQRNERVSELERERFEFEQDVETRVRRNAILEAQLAEANAKVARETERALRAEARVETSSGGATTSTDPDSTIAELKKRLQASEDALFEAQQEAEETWRAATESNLENERSNLKVEELSQKLTDTEHALAAAEGLIGEAELAVAEARREADEAKSLSAGTSGDDSSKNRIAELEQCVAALRSAAAHDAAIVEQARLSNVSSAAATAAEERAATAIARAQRAEKRLQELESAAVADENVTAKAEKETEQWRAALARVPGVNSPAQLVDTVVRLEEELAAALGVGGEASSVAAAATATAAAAMRRAEDAERSRHEAKTNADELLGQLARAERKFELLQREKDSLLRVVKAYDDEASRNAGGGGGGGAMDVGTTTTTPAKQVSPFGTLASASPFSPKPSTGTPETQRRAELDLSLRAAHERIVSLEMELETMAKDGSELHNSVIEQARILSETESARSDAEKTVASLRREVAALEKRLTITDVRDVSVVDFQGLDSRLTKRKPPTKPTKVLHFIQNPEHVANASAAERELSEAKSECAALRETVARLSEAASNNATPDAFWASATPSAFGGLVTPAAKGLGGVPTTGGITTGGAHTTSVQTPGSNLADAELTIAKRKIADLEKREQRLMSAFKKQIYNFRESVSLLFGYKVDMGLDSESGNAVATIRSRYENGDDENFQLRFSVEPAKISSGAGHYEGTITLVPTRYSETSSVKLMVDTFVGKCGSVPAFLANLTMELFNKSEH